MRLSIPLNALSSVQGGLKYTHSSARGGNIENLQQTDLYFVIPFTSENNGINFGAAVLSRWMRAVTDRSAEANELQLLAGFVASFEQVGAARVRPNAADEAGANQAIPVIPDNQ